jgi:hypothetical protein
MPDAHHDDLTAVRSAAERFATVADEPPAPPRSAAERALPTVLGTILGGLALAALGGLTGVLSLGFAAVIVGAAAAVGAGYALLQLAEREARREAVTVAARRAAREAERSARGELVAAVGSALAHVEQLDAERARLLTEREIFSAERRGLADERNRLHGKVDQLERRLTAKDRKIARLQAFDAERRTLEPAPAEDPMAGQLTFDAVAE